MHEHGPAFRRSFLNGTSPRCATRSVLLAVICLLFMQLSSAQNLTLDWAFTMGSDTWDQGSAVTVDMSGDVYIAGVFSGSMDADPGPDTLTLGTIGSLSRHAFIQKLDAAGNLLWAHSFGNQGDARGTSVTTDPSGNVYLTGFFSTTVDFDPGAGVYDLVSIGFPDMFILKLDVAGNFIWARSIGAYDGAPANSVALDAAGNVLITGWFKSTVDLDPGPGTEFHTSNGWEDIYILKLDPMGNFLWAHTLGGSRTDMGTSVTTDPSGNIYLTGEYAYTVDFDPGLGVDTLTASSGPDMFVQKYDAMGNYQWTKTLGGHNGDYGRSIAIDVSGDLYVVGNFSGTSDFDPGPGTFIMVPTGQWNSFVLKLDDSGNFIWARSVRGNGPNSAHSIVTDDLGYAYIVGDFQNTVDLDPGVDSLIITSEDLFDCYTLKLDPTGNMVWVGVFGGVGHDVGLGIAIDGAGALYQTGWFYGSIDFDPTADTLMGTAMPPDLFVMKLNDLTTGVVQEVGTHHVVVYPNPTSGNVSIDINGQVHVTIKVYTALGELVTERKAQVGINTFQLDGPSGLYFVEVGQEERSNTFRVVKY